MTRTVSEVDVLHAIEHALELPPGSLMPDAKAEDVEAWDSLGQLSILLALDKLFPGKVVDNPAMAAATSVPQVLDALRRQSLI